MDFGNKEIILAVEDEEDILELVRCNMEDAGYAAVCATTGEDALEKAAALSPSLVILDIMLPGLNGLEVCKRLKSFNKTRDIPILFLSAKGEESDIVKGLELGADDYIAKPFSPKILKARVNAALRRRTTGQEKDGVQIEGLYLDRAKRTASVEGEPVELTYSEFSILDTLISKRGAAMTRQQIVASIRGGEMTVTERSVDVHMASLRKKLGPLEKLILTVRGVGYRFDFRE